MDPDAVRVAASLVLPGATARAGIGRGADETVAPDELVRRLPRRAVVDEELLACRR